MSLIKNERRFQEGGRGEAYAWDQVLASRLCYGRALEKTGFYYLFF